MFLDEVGWLPQTALGVVLVAMGTALGALLKYRHLGQKQDDDHDINMAAEFRSRLEKVEVDLRECVTKHAECNERLHKLEIADEARKQNDDLHRQILSAVQAMAAEAITGRKAAVDEVKALLQKPAP